MAHFEFGQNRLTAPLVVRHVPFPSTGSIYSLDLGIVQAFKLSM